MMEGELILEQKRQDLQDRLGILLEIAYQSPKDTELSPLIHVVRDNLVANEANPRRTQAGVRPRHIAVPGPMYEGGNEK